MKKCFHSLLIFVMFRGFLCISKFPFLVILNEVKNLNTFTWCLQILHFVQNDKLKRNLETIKLLQVLDKEVGNTG